jgi:hypothetical protein
MFCQLSICIRVRHWFRWVGKWAVSELSPLSPQIHRYGRISTTRNVLIGRDFCHKHRNPIERNQCPSSVRPKIFFGKAIA